MNTIAHLSILFAAASSGAWPDIGKTVLIGIGGAFLIGMIGWIVSVILRRPLTYAAEDAVEAHAALRVKGWRWWLGLWIGAVVAGFFLEHVCHFLGGKLMLFSGGSLLVLALQARHLRALAIDAGQSEQIAGAARRRLFLVGLAITVILLLAAASVAIAIFESRIN
ncbi:MAG: hypothetical protein R3F11_09565 [Verrucomicrobiales bacterium]